MNQELTVVSRRAGFRRAGRAWSAEPTTVAVSEFTPEQLAALRCERMLVVTEQFAVPPSERAERIRAAIAELDPDDKSNFTKSGKPELAKLRDLTALPDVTAAERDRYWAAARGA